MSSKVVTVGLYQTNCYIVEDSSFCGIIDPGDNIDAIKEVLEKEPTHILLTHNHFDHIGALCALHKLYPKALIAIGERDEINNNIISLAKKALGPYFFNTIWASKDFEIPQPNLYLKNGDVIGPLEVISTPGHTMGSVSYYNNKTKELYSGDTLFCQGYGRTDLGGSYEVLMKSLGVLLSLDEDVKVYPGHGCETTIGQEKDYLLN
ncbi:MAG: MBL fold metallo-hydrolase [Sphaerochaetaceae bacterium]|nr:MBL fold metallo-hydrolase [Sphaerochaetaceae bacterium]